MSTVALFDTCDNGEKAAVDRMALTSNEADSDDEKHGSFDDREGWAESDVYDYFVLSDLLFSLLSVCLSVCVCLCALSPVFNNVCPSHNASAISLMQPISLPEPMADICTL